MSKPSDVWYHGTRRGFRRGGILLPRAVHGGAGTNAPVNEGQHSPVGALEWVHITRDPMLAWAYAHAAPGTGRPKVLVVRPMGRPEPDPEHSFRMDAWRCPWAKVLSVHTDSPMSEDEAMAGWVVEPGA